MKRINSYKVRCLRTFKHGEHAWRYVECQVTPGTQFTQSDIIAVVDEFTGERKVGRLTEIRELGWITLDTFTKGKEP